MSIHLDDNHDNVHSNNVQNDNSLSVDSSNVLHNEIHSNNSTVNKNLINSINNSNSIKSLLGKNLADEDLLKYFINNTSTISTFSMIPDDSILLVVDQFFQMMALPTTYQTFFYYNCFFHFPGITLYQN